MSQLVELTAKETHSGITRFEFLVSTDGGALISHGYTYWPNLVKGIFLDEGHTYDFKIIPLNVDTPISEVQISSLVIPEVISQAGEASLTGSWSDESGTLAKSAAGDSGASAEYTFDLESMPGWDSGLDVKVYEKRPQISGVSSIVHIAVDQENTAPPIGPAEAPEFNFSDGSTITTVDEIELTTNSVGASIYYTIDGVGDPDSGDILYTEPFTLTVGVDRTVKAIAVGGGYTASEVITNNYTVELATMTVSDIVVSEGNSAVFMFTLPENAVSDITFDIYTEDGSAIAGTDYIAVTTTKTITTGNTSTTHNVTTIFREGIQGQRSFKMIADNLQVAS